MYRILIVEDDESIARSVKTHLESWNYEVCCAEDFSNVAGTFAAFDPQLVLMDVKLPFFNGYHWCSEIRKVSKVPVIFVSSASDNMNIVMAVSMGGDDFIAKPYQLPILLAHIRAVLRRSGKEKQSSSVRHYKGVTLDLASGMIEKGDKKQILTRNELVILYELFQDQGKIVSRTKLIDRLWDNEIFIDDNTLSVNITRIRAKLDEIGAEDFIETRRGLGYMI